MKDIRAVVLDLDGTLLDSKGQIHQKEIVCLKKIKKKGIRIYIATGRGADAFDIVKDVPTDAIILNNGMRVYYEGELIYSYNFHRQALYNFWNTIREKGIIIGVYKQNEFGKYTDDKRKIVNTEQYVYDVLPERFDKVFVKTGRDCDIKIIEQNLPKQYYLTCTKDGYGFVLPKGISKYTGVKKILDLDKLCMSQVIAFGDDANDIELIKHSGIGVAMGNAAETVQLVADFVTKSSNYDGIAYILNNLLVRGDKNE